MAEYQPTSPSLHGVYRPQSPNLNTLTPTYNDNPYQSSRYGQTFESPVVHQPLAPFAQAPQFAQPFPQQYDLAAMRMKQEDQFMADSKPVKAAVSDPTLGVVLKTSFPVARIKRIMQADEDIGKVAQVTPHVVSRALELFMIKLITSSSEQARGPGGASSKGPRRVLAQHMKRAIQSDETFDFLAEIISKVPDAPAKAKKEVGSDSEDAKPKKRAKRRKDSTDDV